MPDFGTPQSILKFDRKLAPEELIRAIRLFVAAEYEAVQMYMQAAEASSDPAAKKLLGDISSEELVHAGEFSELLFKLSPDDAKFFAAGRDEAGDKMKLASVADMVRLSADMIRTADLRAVLSDMWAKSQRNVEKFMQAVKDHVARWVKEGLYKTPEISRVLATITNRQVGLNPSGELIIL